VSGLRGGVKATLSSARQTVVGSPSSAYVPALADFPDGELAGSAFGSKTALAGAFASLKHNQRIATDLGRRFVGVGETLDQDLFRLLSHSAPHLSSSAFFRILPRIFLRP